MIIFLRNFTDYQPANLVYTLYIKNGASNTKKSTTPNLILIIIGKITDVRVVRYDILSTSRTKQATQQIYPKKKIGHAACEP